MATHVSHIRLILLIYILATGTRVWLREARLGIGFSYIKLLMDGFLGRVASEEKQMGCVSSYCFLKFQYTKVGVRVVLDTLLSVNILEVRVSSRNNVSLICGGSGKVGSGCMG